MPLTTNQIEEGYRLIELAACAGERCPTNCTADNPTGQLTNGVTSALLKQGRIRVEVYAHNWRVIEITKGSHAGKRTASPMNKSLKPYLTLPRLLASTHTTTKGD